MTSTERFLQSIPEPTRTRLINEALPLKPLVAKIEKSPKLTQHHYGRYLNILNLFIDKGHKHTSYNAALLIAAGANIDGVRAAVKFLS